MVVYFKIWGGASAPKVPPKFATVVQVLVISQCEYDILVITRVQDEAKDEC